MRSVGANDQLIKISEAIKVTEMSHVEFIESPDWLEYFMRLKESLEPGQLTTMDDLLKGVDPALKAMIIGCLQLNPDQRLTGPQLVNMANGQNVVFENGHQVLDSEDGMDASENEQYLKLMQEVWATSSWVHNINNLIIVVIPTLI